MHLLPKQKSPFMRSVFMMIILTTISVSLCLARTWHVRADGTGDAPNIHAGIDSASAGDTVLLGPGTHYVYDQGGIEIPGGVTVTSEAGPAETIVAPTVVPTYGIFTLREQSELSGIWIKWGSVGTVSAIGAACRISNNIIEVYDEAVGIWVYEQSLITNNLIVGPERSVGIHFYSCPSGTVVENNIILDGVNCMGCGSFVGGYCNILRGTRVGNCVFGYDADPQFCGMPGSGNFFLQADSPCAPGRIDYCGLIGPLPVACGSVGVEDRTWGAIKETYK
jgi:hypothetical protein